MRVVILGGSGLIGRAGCAHLDQEKHDVFVLSRDPARVVGLPQGVRIVRWDGVTLNGWASLVDGTDAVINLAGENLGGDSLFSLRWTPERKKQVLESRLNAGTSILRAIEAAGIKPKTLIQASAVGYYGVDTGDQDLTEDSPRGEDFLARVCEQWEAVTQPVETLGVRRVVVRLGVVLSMHGGALPRQILPFRFFVGGPIGSGQQWFPWVHIEDVVHAITFLIRKENANGIYNLTAPDLNRNEEFTQQLGELMRRPAIFRAPAFALKIAFGEAASLLLAGQKVYPQKILELGYPFRFGYINEALKNLLTKGV